MEAVADADRDTETRARDRHSRSRPANHRGVLEELARFGPAHERFGRLAYSVLVRAGRGPRAA